MRPTPITVRKNRSLSPQDRRWLSEAPATCPKQISKHYERTDLGNAELFSDIYSQAFRYLSDCDFWLVWNGQRWTPDCTGMLHEKAQEMVRRIMPEHAATLRNQRERIAYATYAGECQARRKITNMLFLARQFLSISSDALDADRWILNVNNGTIDLRSGRLLNHDPSQLLTRMAPVEYRADAECSLWSQFLRHLPAFPATGTPRADLITFIQRSLGYGLTGCTQRHVFWLCDGQEGHAKSALLATMLRIMGDYAISAPQSLLLAAGNSNGNGYDEVYLEGVRLAVASDTECRDTSAAERRKLLTVAGSIQARRLWENSLQFTPTPTIWCAGNALPLIDLADNDLQQRIISVPCLGALPPDERDEELPEKLFAEASGICNWLLAGLAKYREIGLEAPYGARMYMGTGD